MTDRLLDCLIYSAHRYELSTSIFHELSPAQRRPAAIEELAREIASQPFDLVQGPLYRAEVFSRSPDDHVLVLVIHHAIADGWTLGVFVQDLFAAYMQGVRGSHAALPLVLLASHLMHGAAVGFHEATHGLLRRNRRFNRLVTG